jgi:hypothetical protein
MPAAMTLSSDDPERRAVASLAQCPVRHVVYCFASISTHTGTNNERAFTYTCIYTHCARGFHLALLRFSLQPRVLSFLTTRWMKDSARGVVCSTCYLQPFLDLDRCLRKLDVSNIDAILDATFVFMHVRVCACLCACVFVCACVCVCVCVCVLELGLGKP